MSNPSPDRIPAEVLTDLAQAMRDMRVTLLKASLLLHAPLFNHDKTGRGQAAVLSDAWIGEARSQ